MQDLLTLTLESIAIATALMMVADFFCGLSHLYNASATTTQDKAEEAMAEERTAEEIVIAVEPTQGDPDETTSLDDPWIGEIEVINECCCKSELPSVSVVYLLPPAQEVVEQPEIDFSGWSIRALKKEAQRRKLSKYSSLTKAQLLTALTAA